MIKKVTITNYLGDSLAITLAEAEPKHGLLITEIDGLGPVKADIHLKSNAIIDGSKYNSARAQNRNIVITFRFQDNPYMSIEDIRQSTYKYFPLKQELRFEIETDNRTLFTMGRVESNEPDIFTDKSGCQISIICESSYFRKVGDTTATVSILKPEFEFPFDNNSVDEKLIEFGEYDIRRECIIVYEGDAPGGIIINAHIMGTVRNLTIFDVTTRGQMSFSSDIITSLTGSGLIAGDQIIVNTNLGKQNVQLFRNGKYYNILNALDKSSAQWFQLSKGDNIFSYTAEQGEQNVLLELVYDVLYEGV